MLMKRIGFLVNPIAGMGGRVGLKGTDGVVEQAIALGAEPGALDKAAAALDAFHHLRTQLAEPPGIQWFGCAAPMGAELLRVPPGDSLTVVHTPAAQTSAADTRTAAGRFLDHAVELIFFCGGDGTARDICAVVGDTVPILGVPSGVKMYSGVFGVSVRRSAQVLLAFLQDRIGLAKAEVLDLDEARYRQGEWRMRLYYAALTPFEPSCTQSSKQLITASADAEVKEEIGEYLRELIQARPQDLFLLGPGSTVQYVARQLGVEKTLLGIDAYAAAGIVGSDLNEAQILALLPRYDTVSLILSPIGAQGFIFGRGNLQLSPEVVRRIGRANLVVAATPAKLKRTPALRVDTGDAALDRELIGGGYLPVVIGCQRRRLVKVEN